MANIPTSAQRDRIRKSVPALVHYTETTIYEASMQYQECIC